MAGRATDGDARERAGAEGGGGFRGVADSGGCCGRSEGRDERRWEVNANGQGQRRQGPGTAGAEASGGQGAAVGWQGRQGRQGQVSGGRERWRKVRRAPGYKVSSEGRVRSVDRTLTDGRAAGGVMLEPVADEHGRRHVELNGERVAVATLV